ncbi:uncharacterized protein LOC130683990 [Manis pentadactyla]|uniref:uncharacterized protein LOC130683990 n=1 Tax=Manis pentadactyla TaxID=143292 RepID=UPI00255C8758|nr:uncharacterized protein LOC130683990 [Manis pentadactyla]
MNVGMAESSAPRGGVGLWRRGSSAVHRAQPGSPSPSLDTAASSGVHNAHSCLLAPPSSLPAADSTVETHRPRATSSAPGSSPPRPQGAAGDRGLCHLCAQDEEGLTLLPSPPAACCPPCLLPPSCPEGPSQRQGADRGLHRFSSQCHPPGTLPARSSCSFSETPVFPGLGPHSRSSQKHTHTESEVTSSSLPHPQDFSVMGGDSEDKEGAVLLRVQALHPLSWAWELGEGKAMLCPQQ